MTTASFASTDEFPRLRSLELSIARLRYRYRTAADNAVAPVSAAGRIGYLSEIYNASWALRHLPLVIAAEINRRVKHPVLAVLDRIGMPSSLAPYDAIPGFYHPIPTEVRDHADDGLFAFRRVAGACPTIIERITTVAELATKMPLLDDATFRRVTESTNSLATEIAANRIFVVDYVRLSQALLPQHPSNNHDSRFRGKYLPAPVLVLFERPASGSLPADLVPVAITADQPGTTPNPMFTPLDGEAFQIAKTYVEVADNNWHFGVGHLWRCHFLMEAFAMATRRQLPRKHPIRMLLDPHLRFTLFTNIIAYSYFANPGQLYDTMYAGSLEESRRLFESSSVARQSVLDHLPSRDLAARKMDVGLARYPWRDDALAWEDLVRRYVRTVVDAFYPDDASVRADAELVAFAGELTGEATGNLPGLFATVDRASLVEALTLAIYTGGAGHSAMHFPMFDLYTYAPTACESAFAAPPTAAGEASAVRFKHTLPPPAAALENFYQVEIGHFRYDVFGVFDGYAIDSLDRAAPALATLRSDIAALATTIEARERTAPPRRAYPYLHPSLVTNSVNI